MIRNFYFSTPLWSIASTVFSCLVLIGVWGMTLDWKLLILVAAALIVAVVVAVHHAEVIALRVGEPFGTLVLALAITVIEVSLIVSLMLPGGAATNTLARDTVYATVMIVCNGVIGLCLLFGALRHRVLAFRVEGTTPALSVLVTLAVLTLVLPSFTLSTSGPTLNNIQLGFVGLVSLTLYGVFVFVQTVRHRNYFLPVNATHDTVQVTPPSTAQALVSFVLLFLCLVSVVGLAKALAPNIEAVVKATSTPKAVIGIAIALLVLLPETWAALRSALRNHMQISFNLALGSALATIGLTIPVVAATALIMGLRLDLGLPAKEMVLLMLTLMISAMTLSGGRATVLQGAVHLVLFAVFLFLAVVP